MSCSRDLSIHNISEGYAKPLNKSNDRAPSPLPKVIKVPTESNERREPTIVPEEPNAEDTQAEPVQKVFLFFEPKGCLKERDDFSLYIFPPDHP